MKYQSAASVCRQAQPEPSQSATVSSLRGSRAKVKSHRSRGACCAFVLIAGLWCLKTAPLYTEHMNLVSTLQIHAGGPGSGCNPSVGKCGRPAGDGDAKPSASTRAAVAKRITASFVDAMKRGDPDDLKNGQPKAFERAALALANAGIDQRLIEYRQVPEIKIGQRYLVPVRGLSALSGQFQRATGDIIVADSNDEDTLVHEYAHHLDAAWLYQDSDDKLLSGGPAIDQAKNIDMRAGMYAEFVAARDDAAAQLGDEDGWTGGDDRYAFIQDKLDEINVRAPRAYSLSNLREWYATSFEEYMKGEDGRVRLNKIAPETYKYISSFIHGKLFKNANN